MPKGIKGFQKGHKINVGKPVSQETRGKISLSNTKEDAGKSALHLWVVKWKGRPLKCEMCGTNEKKFYDWANIDHKYNRVLEDYIRMCRSCHRNYDIKHNNYPKNALKS